MNNPPTETDRTIRAPWTDEQVEALNAFQQYGGMHPFTCGNDHATPALHLVAHEDGWHCWLPDCDYRQNWAHAFMADPSAWPRPFGERHGPTPQEMAAASPTTTDRAAVSAKLWEIAEHHIVAEWICCEPLDPKHDLCAQGYAALGMARTLLVDSDPEQAWNPAAPVLDAVMAVLNAGSEDTTTTRTGTLREAAEVAERLMDERYGPDCSYAIGGLDVANELRRLAAETQPSEAHPPTHTWTVESPRRDTWASWGATYEEREWAQERCESAIENAPQRPFRLVRATTTYTVEAEHQPAAASAGVQTDEETSR